MKANQVEDKSQPDPDQIYEMLYNGWRVHILKTAIQLDVFTAIANELNTVEKLVSAKNWARRPTRVLLNGLCPLFLSKKGGEYLLTSTSETFLVRNRKTYAGDSIGYFLSCDAWQQLAETVKTGESKLPDACSPELSTFWKQDATMESMRQSRISGSLEMWRTVGIDPDARQGIRVLDLACGCSIKSFALARQNSNVSITCVEWAGVLEVARRLAEKWGILKQVSFLPGDLSRMDYGDSEFDVVLLGQITHLLSVAENDSVLRRVYRALKSGGSVVVHSLIADEERCKSEALFLAVVVFTLFGGKGEFYTFSEYKAILEEVGFAKIVKHGESIISARK